MGTFLLCEIDVRVTSIFWILCRGEGGEGLPVIPPWIAQSMKDKLTDILQGDYAYHKHGLQRKDTVEREGIIVFVPSQLDG